MIKLCQGFAAFQHGHSVLDARFQRVTETGKPQIGTGIPAKGVTERASIRQGFKGLILPVLVVGPLNVGVMAAVIPGMQDLPFGLAMADTGCDAGPTDRQIGSSFQALSR